MNGNNREPKKREVDRKMRSLLVSATTARHIDFLCDAWGVSGGEVVDQFARAFARRGKGAQKNDK